MTIREPSDRFTVPDACRRVERQFDLPYGVHDQDWEHILADPARANDFIAGYDVNDPDSNFRFALAAITIGSVDEGLALGSVGDATLEQLRRILIIDSDTLAHLLYRWCCFDASNAEEYFMITPFIRSVWNEAFGASVPTTLPSERGDGPKQR